MSTQAKVVLNLVGDETWLTAEAAKIMTIPILPSGSLVDCVDCSSDYLIPEISHWYYKPGSLPECYLDCGFSVEDEDMLTSQGFVVTKYPKPAPSP